MRPTRSIWSAERSPVGDEAGEGLLGRLPVQAADAAQEHAETAVGRALLLQVLGGGDALGEEDLLQGGEVLGRDSKDTSRGTFAVSSAAWSAFVTHASIRH
ncbi:DUF397 domain-containing protein [Streptomyces sp. JNUCC 63]